MKRSLLKYGDNVAAPAIQLPNVEWFKTERGALASNYFQNRIAQLQQEYNELVNLADINDMVYNAEYTFVPRVNQTYYLYERQDKTTFLSLISPEEWEKEGFVGSFRYTADSIWENCV